MNTDERTKIFDVVATELCRRVDLPYPPPKGTKYEVDAATWTEVEENDFRKWMMDYFLTIPRWKRMGKISIKREIMWFILQYSWKYKRV